MALCVTLVGGNGLGLSGSHANTELELIKMGFWLKRSKNVILALGGMCGTFTVPVLRVSRISR